jgi:hypothetical protein
MYVLSNMSIYLFATTLETFDGLQHVNPKAKFMPIAMWFVESVVIPRVSTCNPFPAVRQSTLMEFNSQATRGGMP